MKKTIILYLFAIILLSGCQSTTYQYRKIPPQENKKPKFSSPVLQQMNIIAGLGKSGIGGPKSGKSWKDPLGGTIGLETTIYKFTENSSIRTGLNVTFQGADYTLTETEYEDFGYSEYSPEISGKVPLTYLNLPLLFQYSWQSGFFAEAGLQPGLLLSAKDKIDGSESYDYKDFMKGFELGLPVGIGYHINKQLAVGIQGVWGLTNNSNSGSGDKDHNYIILGTVSYRIGSLFSSKE
jgi:hypothetical protein